MRKHHAIKLFLFSLVILTGLLAYHFFPIVGAGATGTGNLPANLFGNAHAGSVTVSAGPSNVSVPPIAPVYVDCAQAPGTKANSTVSVSHPPTLTVGAATDKVVVSRSSTSASISSHSTIDHAEVLNGLISATQISVAATSTVTSGQAISTNQVSFSYLKIVGLSINSNNPAPNTTLPLPGLGQVVLNEQIGPVNSLNGTHTTINAIDVHITTKNILGLPIGAQILVGHVTSQAQRSVLPNVMQSYAYGLYATVGGTVTFGPSPNVSMSCGRTGTVPTQVATLHLPLLGSTGLASNTVSNSTTSSGGQTKSNSTLADVNLLGGLIKADAVKVDAQVTDTNGTTAGSTSMTLTNATIAGVSITGTSHPLPNKHISLAGLGDVYLNESSVTNASSGTVAVATGIDIRVTAVNNVLGVPVGTRIIVGRASSQIGTY